MLRQSRLSTFAELAAVRDPFAKRRFIGFLGVHFLAFGSEVFAILNFALSGDKWFCSFLSLTFLFSGAFCAHAAWHCEVPQLDFWSQMLPLKSQPWPKSLLLLLLLGIGQGIILVLALEEFYTRRHDEAGSRDLELVPPVPPLSSQDSRTGSSGEREHIQPDGGIGRQVAQGGTAVLVAGASGEPGGGAVGEMLEQGLPVGSVESSAEVAAARAQEAPATASNKFHCKAVNGLFEGLLSSAVILYAYWSLDFPFGRNCFQPETPKCPDVITKRSGPFAEYEQQLLGFVGVVSFLSSGLGLLEMDFCTSRTISKRIRKSPRYEAFHLLFRSCEVASKVSVFILFMVITRNFTILWWVPLALDFVLTVVLVLVFGGNDTFLVSMLVSIPCVFADVFAFIDTPYKIRAATQLSRSLNIKHGVWVWLVLPCLAWAIVFVREDGAADLQNVLNIMWQQHCPMMISVLIAVPLHHFCFLWYAHCNGATRRASTMADIYSACAGGDVEDVRSAIRDLTQSAAVGVDINKPDIDGNTPLALAAGAGHASVCELLIKEGACVSSRIMADDRPLRGCLLAQVRLRWTALHIAAARGHHDATGVLVKTTAPDQPELFEDQNGDTPLHVAARYHREEVARVLAAWRPDWRRRYNFKQESPGDLASASVQRAMEAQSAEPPPSLQERGGRTPLLEEGGSEGRPIHSSSDVSGPRRSSSDVSGRSMEWSEEVLKIRRVAPKDELIAPGLCSYVASSCGGALGKIFLAQVQVAPARDEASFTAEADGRDESRDASFSTQVEGAPSVSDLVYLQPVGSNLEPVSWWQAQLADARAGAASVNQVLGASFARLSLWPPTVAELGRGTYGVVWRGRDTRNGTQYAVKTIQTAGNRGKGAVAQREFEVADRIRVKPHPCIVRLHHVHNFTEAALYVLVMEFCPGGDLVAKIRGAKAEARNTRGSYRPPPQATRWIGQVFLGLEHMHCRMKTLLRDLKPDNVVLSSDGNAKLTDFGFGRFGVQSSGAWSFGIPTGSPGYVAPEVLRQERTGSPADLYSLGILVWVLLTGGVTNRTDPTPPVSTCTRAGDFKAFNDDFKLIAACLRDPQRNHARELPPDQKDFVAKLTERRPDRRLTHQHIRRHAMLLPLGLPSFRDGPTRVDRWLQGAPSTPLSLHTGAPARPVTSTPPQSPTAAPAPGAAGLRDRGSSGGSCSPAAPELRRGAEGCELPPASH